MGGYGISISTTNPDPVRTIKFLDYLASDEGQILNNWGIEGKHYKVENGKRVVPQEVQDRINNDNTAFTKETGIGFYWNMMVHYGDGAKDSTGNYYTKNFPEQLVLGYSDVEKETLAAYKATTWKDLFPKEEEFKEKAYGAAWNISIPGEDEVSILGNKMKDITWKRIPQAILAKPAEFDKIWDDYMADLEKVTLRKWKLDIPSMCRTVWSCGAANRVLCWVSSNTQIKGVVATAEILDFRPLLFPDLLIRTAVRGRNPETKADANTPTVPKSPPSLPPLSEDL